MRFLSKHSLEALLTYRYHAIDNSLLGNYVMTPFWNYILNWIPLGVAPNCITFIGLVIVLFAACVLSLFMYGCPWIFNLDQRCTFSGAVGDVLSNLELVPSWVWFLCSASIFWYSTLDALDGKQARRIHAGSPLGELVDHGCDAITTVLIFFMSTSILTEPMSVTEFSMSTLGACGFVFTMWQQYFTGQMTLGYINGPTEGVLSCSFMAFLTGIFGVQLWRDPGMYPDFLKFNVKSLIPFFYLEVNNWQILLFCAFVVLGAIQSIYAVYTVVDVATHKPKRDRILFLLDSFLHILPFLSLYLLSWHFFLVFFVPMQNYYFAIEFILGLISAIAGTRLTIKRIIGHKFSFAFPSFIMTYTFYIVSLCTFLFGFADVPTIALWFKPCLTVLAVTSVVEYVGMLYLVFNEIAKFLKINILTLTPTQKKYVEKLSA